MFEQNMRNLNMHSSTGIRYRFLIFENPYIKNPSRTMMEDLESYFILKLKY